MRVLIGMAALATLGVAARHLYVQSLPPGTRALLRRAALGAVEVLAAVRGDPKVLTGSGECGEVNWRFLGLAMPAWVAAVGARRAGGRCGLRRATSGQAVAAAR